MKLSLSILFALLCGNVFSQWTNDTTMNTPVRDTAGALTPLQSRGPNKGTYITWFEYDSISNLALHLQLLDSNGYSTWAPEGIVVSDYPQSSSLSYYDLETDNDGNAIVAFQDYRSSVSQIMIYKIDAAGNSLWGGVAGVQLTDSFAAEGIAPSIAITPQNNIYVAWNADYSSGRGISCMRLSPAGTVLWFDNYRIYDTAQVFNYSRPKLLPFGIDDVQMVYVREAGSFPSGTSTLFAQRINANGVNISPSPIQLSTNTVSYFFIPNPVADGPDQFYIAFDSSNPSNSLIDVYVQHVDASGNTWNATGMEAENSTTNHKSLFASCLSSQNEFWVLLRIMDPGQSMTGVSVQKFDAAGNVMLGPDGILQVAMDGNDNIPFSISDVNDGVIFTVAFGGFGAQRIYAMKLDYAGMPSWPFTNVSISAAYSGKDDLSAGIYTGNSLVFVWQDDRNGLGIFAQNINADGSTGIITALNNLPADPSAGLYPNPSVNSVIYLENNGSRRSITLYDCTGKQIEQQLLQNTELEFQLSGTNLPDGLYFVRITEGNKPETLKWIKQ